MKLADPTLFRHPALIEGTRKDAGFSVHNPASGEIDYASGFIKWFAAMAQRNLGGLA